MPTRHSRTAETMLSTPGLIPTDELVKAGLGMYALSPLAETSEGQLNGAELFTQLNGAVPSIESRLNQDDSANIPPMLMGISKLYAGYPRRAMSALAINDSSRRVGGNLSLEVIGSLLALPEPKRLPVLGRVIDEKPNTLLDSAILPLLPDIAGESADCMIAQLFEKTDVATYTMLDVISYLAIAGHQIAATRQVAKLVKKTFASDRLSTFEKKCAAELIEVTHESEQDAFRTDVGKTFYQCLEACDPEALITFIPATEYASPQDKPVIQAEISTFLYKTFSDSDPTLSYLHYKSADLIGYALQEDRANIIRAALDSADRNPDRNQVFVAVMQIGTAAPQDRASLLEEIIDTPWLKSSHISLAIHQLHNLPPDDRVAVIGKILHSKNITTSNKLDVAYQIDGMDDPDVETIKDQLRSIVSKQLNKPRLDTLKLHTLHFIFDLIDVPEAPHIQTAVGGHLRRLLDSSSLHPRDVSHLVNIIEFAPDEDKDALYLAAQESLFRSLRGKATGVLDDVFRAMEAFPKGKMREIPSASLLAPPSNEWPSRSPLHRAVRSGEVIKFGKSDSETFIGDNEQNVRIINFSSFDAWLKAYTTHEAWAEFGYVPIEPICDARWADKKSTKVAVKTITLRGESLRNSLGFYNDTIILKIYSNVKRIKQILKQTVGIDHEHAHAGNFVLVPQHTEGRPDPNKLPRIYMIDFDMAHQEHIPASNFGFGGA